MADQAIFCYIMQLVTRAQGVLVSSYCCSTYRVAVPFNSLGTFSGSFIGGPVIHPIVNCEHPLLCLLGPGIVSQETAISGSFQQNLASVCDGVSVWRLIVGWIPRYGSLQMDHPFVSAPNFVSVTPSIGVLFPILRRGKVSKLWSLFFLIFMCFANCILGILSFWANIHLSVNANQVISFCDWVIHCLALYPILMGFFDFWESSFLSFCIYWILASYQIQAW